MRVRTLATLLAAVLLSGCGAAPRKDMFYRLPEVAGVAAASEGEGTVIYVPPFLADGLHGERALVYAHDDGTALEQYTYDYWVDSPRLLLQQALAERLRAGGAQRVVTSPSSETRYTVRGRIRKFERRGASAEVSLEFELLSAATEVPVFVRGYERSVPLGDDAMSTCARALGEAAQDELAKFVTDLEGYWGR